MPYLEQVSYESMESVAKNNFVAAPFKQLYGLARLSLHAVTAQSKERARQMGATL